MTKTRTLTADIPYAPSDWNGAQLDAHRASSLEEAFHKASCLAGGWYGRPVTIDWQVGDDNAERYMLRPADVPALDGWAPCYTIAREGR